MERWLVLNPRYAFGKITTRIVITTHHVLWDIQRFLNPEVEQDSRSFFLPWCQTYIKITIEDVKYVLSSHYQDSSETLWLEGDTIVVGPSVPLASNRPARRRFSNCGQIVHQEMALLSGPALFTAALYAGRYDTGLFCQHDRKMTKSPSLIECCWSGRCPSSGARKRTKTRCA